MIPRRRRSRKGDRGSGPVEFAVLAFPLLLLTFIVVQAAFVFYARSTALAAATQGANAARAYNAPLSSGTAKANDFLTRIGGGIKNPSVFISSSGNQVTVTVTGEAQTIIPFVRFPVSQSASGPIERFTS
jgi:Flp pilus assembly protein TadG